MAGRLISRGHAAAQSVVERAVAGQRPPHALLLSGPERVGKTTLALDLAAGLLCQATDPAARPCRECSACRRVASGNHPDLHRLAPEGAGGQIRLGQVQALAAELALLPLEGSFRVAVVEQAQRLNLDAQHALLKTLEEPPPKVVLILAADEPAGLLPTVVSRCARLRLGAVGAEVIAELLAEAGLADASRAAALARLSGGRPGVAMALAAHPETLLSQARLGRSLLDLLRADRHERLAAVPALLEDAAALAGAAATPAGADEATSPVPATSSRAPARATPAERRAAVAALLAAWRLVARDLSFAARGGTAAVQQHELLDELAQLAPAVDAEAMTRFVDRLETASRALDSYANPELALDVLLLDWPSARAATAAAGA
ncbi:MAG TPA: DNA polymerase III subunit delta' [Candidatus Limnocylindrales bacterium]